MGIMNGTAYFQGLKVKRVKCLLNQHLGSYSQSLIFFVTYELA
jgi:hypothetical protein